MQRPIPLVGVGIFVIFTCLFALAFGGVLLPLQAQSTGAVKGVVTGDSDQPLANVRVNIYRPENYTGFIFWDNFSSTTTDASGVYTFTGLEDGGYRIGFQPEDSPRVYFPEFYDNATQVWEGTDITITAGSMINNINAQLSSGAHIKGRVTGPSSEPLRNIRVRATSHFASADATTGADGYYDIKGLEAGEYQVLFEDTREPARFADEYFDNADFYSLTLVTVATDQIRAGIDAQLDQLAALTGTVVNAQANPVKDIYVTAEKFYNDSEGPYWYGDSYGQTDASGIYTITGLQPGMYRVLFEDGWRRYSTQYYEHAYNPSAATPITLTYNSTMTNVNVQLVAGSRITGVVTDMAGQPLAGIRVRAEDYHLDVDRYIWRTIYLTETKANGEYNLCCLSPESYRVSFSDPSQQYITEYYDDVPYPDVFGPDTVSMIPVTLTKPTTNVNAMLSTHSVISGIVTNEEAQPLDNIQVNVERYDLTGGGYWNQQNSVTTGIDGKFVVSGLLPGRHRVLFSDVRYPQQYLSTIIKESPDLDQEGAFTVSASSAYTYNVAMRAGALITGTVTDNTGDPIEGIYIVIYQPTDYPYIPWAEFSSTYSDSQGHYMFGGLHAGTYRIAFKDGSLTSYFNEFYDNATSLESATDIVITDGELLPNIDVQLDQFGQVHGQVTDENNNPFDLATLSFVRYTDVGEGNFQWQEYRATQAYETGFYHMTGLEPGRYRIYVEGANGITGQYQSEWYDNRGYAVAATILEIAANTVLTDVNIQLAAEPFTWPPLAQNDEVETQEGGSVSLLLSGSESLLGNDFRDTDAGELQATPVVTPEHGVLVFDSNGTFTYQHDGSESKTDHFTYRANDGVKQSNIATVTVTINPVNDLPTAVDDTASVIRGQSITTLSSGAASVLANDSDPDDSTLTATVTAQPQHGTLTLNSDGTFLYTHNGDAATGDSFGYKVTDSFGASDTATVTLTITEPVVAPAFTFSKTVGLEGIKPACTLVGETKVPVETTIVYCYTVRNTGDVTLTTHSLVDSHLGQLLNNVSHTLAPGAVFSTTFTQTLTITTTNVATWTATAGNNGQRFAPTAPLMETAATVRISGPNDDADGDTIPDNLERAGDIDEDNIPNFLDTDADGDGTLDRDEVGSNPRSPVDSDNDGIPDYLDSSTQPNTTRKILLPVIQR